MPVFLRLATLVWLLFGLAGAAAQEQSGLLRIVYNDSWQPYSAMEGDGAGGILPDLMDELLARRLGVEVQHLFFPWKRAQALVWSGQADAMVTVPTKERAEHGKIGAEPVLKLHIRPIVASDNKSLQSELTRLGADFSWKDRRFCHGAGSNWHRNYTSAQGIEAFVAKDIDACVRMIAAGRVDGALQVQAVARSAINRQDLGDRTMLVDATIEVWDFALILRRDYPGGADLLTRLDELLVRMQASGELESLWKNIEDRNVRN